MKTCSISFFFLYAKIITTLETMFNQLFSIDLVNIDTNLLLCRVHLDKYKYR